MKKIKIGIPIIITMFLLTGCWDNLPLKQAAMVMGTGIAKKGDNYLISLEFLKTSGGANATSSSTPGPSSLVLERKGETLFSTIRDFIRDTKRRVFFTHNHVWIIQESVARDNILKPFDLIGRDQMFRLDSNIFITKDNPREVLNTPVLFSGLSSLELSKSMSTVKFVSDYSNPDLKDFFHDLSSAVQTTFVPMIHVVTKVNKRITEIDGTALIKGEKMVGTLNPNETMGLLWILGKIETGSITVSQGSESKKITLELTPGNSCKIIPHIKNNEVSVDLYVNVHGTLAVVPPDQPVTKNWIHQVSNKISQHVTKQIQNTLNKLQKKYQTDVTKFGLLIYRKDYHYWHRVKDHWDKVYSKTKVHIHVKVNIYHQGLINQTHGRVFHKPQNNPYSFIFR